MLTKKLAIAAAASIAFSMGAYADNNDKTPGSGPNPYVDCGIGAALFPTVHWAAVTSNVIWDLGTTALTSATASPETCSGKRLEAALFINDTYDNLAEDIARGDGQHLATVLNILECDAARQGDAIANARGAMASAVGDETYLNMSHLEKAAQLFIIMDHSTTRSCSA